MSKICPICREEFSWHFCRSTTYTKNDGVNRFCVAPSCRHISSFAKDIGIIEDSIRSLWEARWDVEAERMFSEYTKRWTDTERTSFRAQIWPPKPVREETYQDNVPWR